MQFKLGSLAAVALLASFGQAILIPTGQENGVYTVSFDSNGNALETPKLIMPLNTTIRPALERRSGPILVDAWVQRGSANSINRNDFDEAWAQFDSLCDKGVTYPSSSAAWIIYNSAIAYMCNYSKSNRCWRSEYDESVALEDIVSGPNQLGWVYTQTFDKSYGRDNAGASICE